MSNEGVSENEANLIGKNTERCNSIARESIGKKFQVEKGDIHHGNYGPYTDRIETVIDPRNRNAINILEEYDVASNDLVDLYRRSDLKLSELPAEYWVVIERDVDGKGRLTSYYTISSTELEKRIESGNIKLFEEKSSEEPNKKLDLKHPETWPFPPM